MPSPRLDTADATDAIVDATCEWFAHNSRDLPWRRDTCTPWGVLVSEIMLQQTPVSRVLPRWQQWMERWPKPADLAAEPQSEVLRAWDRLGYPRRAARLHQAAQAITENHDGRVPHTTEELRALPGIGEYTAAAVRTFAYGLDDVVVDTNVRRVLARIDTGEQFPPKTYTAAERRLATAYAHAAGARQSAQWNAGVMELGAVICTARKPTCDACPLRSHCAWAAAGYPAFEGERARSQKYHGTDRYVRGLVLAALRASDSPVHRTTIDALWHDNVQLHRAVTTLKGDGLIETHETTVALA